MSESNVWTDEQLDHLEALALRATEGPWGAYDTATGKERYVKRVWLDGQGRRCTRFVTGAIEPDDAEFIAAARLAVPELIAEIRKMRTTA